MPRNILACLCIAAVLAVAGPSQGAAVLTGTATNVGDTDYNLTDLGTLDWAYWNSTGTGTPTNQKASATAIGNITALGGSVQGSSSTTRPAWDFAWEGDGTSPVTGTQDNPNGRFSNQFDTVGAGVSLNFTLPTAGWYDVYVWGGAYAINSGTFTAKLGIEEYTDATISDTDIGNPKTSYLYRLSAYTSADNQTLNIEFRLTSDLGASGNSHVLIGAAAISAVPTPAALPAGLAMLGLIGTRRRQRR